MKFDKDFLGKLFEQAVANPRLRQNYDLRTSSADTSQRMLNALLPGTVVPIHQHEDTTETVVCLCGRLDEVIYEEIRNYGNEEVRKVENIKFPMGMDSQDVTCKVEYREVQRIHLCPTEAKYGCQIPKGAWHTVEVIEPSVIFEAKDGAYKKNVVESKGSKEPYNDDLQNGMNSIIEFLKESKKYANKTSPYYKYSRFIYRGISKFYPHKSNEGVEHPIVEDVENDTIRSGLSVRLDMTIQRENLNAEKSKPYIRANYVNALRDMIRTAKKQFPNKYTTNMSDLDILADIQHNGGATCLVDFSKNILTALWFACSNDLGADGFVYCYDVMNDIIVNDNLSYVKDENMSIESLLAQTYQETNICSDVDTRFCIWEPTPHNNRIIRQDSVFIFGMEKFIVKDHEINVIKIEANKKRNILLAMEALFNISENTIFDDYIGFANANRKTLSYHKLEFNAYTRGFDDMIDGNYEAALEFLKLHEGECSSGNERDLIELHFSLAVIYKYLVRAKNTIRYEENAISEYDEVIRLIKNVFKKGSFLYLDELKRKKDKDYLIRKCTRAYNGIFDMLYNTKQYQRAILKCNNLIEDIEKGILHNEGQSLPMKKNFSPIYCRITQMELLDLQIITSMSRLENINKEDLNSFNAQIESYYNEAQSILRGDVFFDEILVEYYYFICKVLLATDESRLNTCYLRKFLEFKERYNNENPYNGYILWNFAEIKDAIENIDYRIPHQKKEMLLAATAQIIAFRDEFEVHSLRCSQDY